MKLLAIETATDACSCALWLDGTVSERHKVAPKQHAEVLLANLDSLLAEADIALPQLDGIAFGRGPGSFTGVRIAAAAVQGIALGRDLPVAPVSTLAAMAQGAVREQGAERVIAALDARRGEVYIGRFRLGASGLVMEDAQEAVLPPGQVPAPDTGGWWGVGAGFNAEQQTLRQRLKACLHDVESERLPFARDVAALGAALLQAGKGVDAARALPVYLREKVAEKPRALAGAPTKDV